MVDNIKKRGKMILFSLKLLNDNKTGSLFLIHFINICLALLPFILVQINGLLINSVVLKDFRQMMTYFIGMICVTCLNTVLTNIFSYKILSFQYNLNLSVQEKIIRKSQKIRFEKFEDSNLYDKLKRASESASTQPYQLFFISLQLIRNLIQFIYVIILLSQAKIQGIYLFFIVAIILVIPNFRLIKRENQLQKELAISYRKKNYFRNLVETMPTVREVRIFQVSDFFCERFLNIGNAINMRIIDYGKRRNVLEGICTIIIFAFASVYQFICIKNTIKGIYSIGEMSVYIQVISRVNGVVTETLSSIYEIYKISLFIEYLYEYLRLEEENTDQDILLSQILQKDNNVLKFENVTFKYPYGHQYVFSDLSFTLAEGELLAIVGENGAGKSTIINLLCRLYEPQKGEILINNVSLDKINLYDWRRSLNVTFQEFIKYEMSLFENITLGITNKEADLNSLLEKMKVNKISGKLKNGLDSQIGVIFDNGTQLSQGEWQKIAICRSLYKSGKILILDEPSAALDKESEESMIKEVKAMLKQKRILFALLITHNYDNLKYADKVLKLG